MTAQYFVHGENADERVCKVVICDLSLSLICHCWDFNFYHVQSAEDVG